METDWKAGTEFRRWEEGTQRRGDEETLRWVMGQKFLSYPSLWMQEEAMSGLMLSCLIMAPGLLLSMMVGFRSQLD